MNIRKEVTKEIKIRKNLLDISEGVPSDMFKELRMGQILKFNKDGAITNYKIVRLNKKSKKCLVQEVQLYREDEVEVVDRELKNV